MSQTPDVDRSIAINKSEAVANQHAGDAARAKIEAGARVIEREDNAGRVCRGELDRAGAIVERQQTNKIKYRRGRSR